MTELAFEPSRVSASMRQRRMAATELPPQHDPASVVDAVFVRDETAVTRRIAGETIIVPVRNDVADLDSIYTLNETGSFIWELLDGQRTVATLVDAVVEEFEVDRELAASDVARLVASLRDEGLLRLRHG
jgi:hypothetical protein